MKRRSTRLFLSGCAVALLLAFAFLHWTLGHSTPVRFENR